MPGKRGKNINFEATILHKNVSAANPGIIMDIWKAKNLKTSLTSKQLKKEMRKAVPSLLDDFEKHGIDLEKNNSHFINFKERYLGPIKQFNYPQDGRIKGRNDGKILEKRKPPSDLFYSSIDDTSNRRKFKFDEEKFLNFFKFLQLPHDFLQEIHACVACFKTTNRGAVHDIATQQIGWQKTQLMVMGVVQFLIFSRKLSAEEARSCFSALPFDLHVSFGVDETKFTDEDNEAYGGYDYKLKQTLKRIRSSLKPTPGKPYPFTTDFLATNPRAQEEFHRCCKCINWGILESDFDDMNYDHMVPIKKHYPNNGSSGYVSASPAAAGNDGTDTPPTETTGKESSGTTSNAKKCKSERTNTSNNNNHQQKFDSDSNEKDSCGDSDTDDSWPGRVLRPPESGSGSGLIFDSSDENSIRSGRKHLRRGGDCRSTVNAEKTTLSFSQRQSQNEDSDDNQYVTNSSSDDESEECGEEYPDNYDYRNLIGRTIRRKKDGNGVGAITKVDKRGNVGTSSSFWIFQILYDEEFELDGKWPEYKGYDDDKGNLVLEKYLDSEGNVVQEVISLEQFNMRCEVMTYSDSSDEDYMDSSQHGSSLSASSSHDNSKTANNSGDSLDGDGDNNKKKITNTDVVTVLVSDEESSSDNDSTLLKEKQDKITTLESVLREQGALKVVPLNFKYDILFNSDGDDINEVLEKKDDIIDCLAFAVNENI